MSKKKASKINIISIRQLSQKTGVEYFKIYNNLHKNYVTDTLDQNEKTTIVNTLIEEITPLLKTMGFVIKVERLK